MMRAFRSKLSTTVLVLLVVAVHCAPCDAQRRRRPSGGRARIPDFGMMALFQIPRVQGEIDLTLPQAELVLALQSDLNTEFRSARRDRNAQDLPTADQVAKDGEAVAEKILSAVLRPKQFTRLKELYLQRMGLRAIDTDKMADALQLTSQQRDDARELLKDLSREYGRGPISDNDSRVAEEITDLLTDEQKDQWEAMLGDSFEFRR